MRRSSGPRRRALEEGVEPVLRLQPVALVGPLQARADDAPGAEAPLQRIVGVFRKMGASEGAEPEMDDAGRQRGAVIAGAADGRRQGTERGGGEARHSL